MSKITTPEDFSRLAKQLLNRAAKVRSVKAEEYSPGDDRLENFRKAAFLRKKSMQDVIAGMMVKHTVSIYDMIDGVHLIDKWKEKFCDQINFILLLYAAIIEEME